MTLEDLRGPGTMPTTPHAFTTYTVQTWQGDRRPLDDLTGLSIDAARHIAGVHAALGYTVRLMAEGVDYCEVYQPDGHVRRGTFARTTRVVVA